MLQVTLNASHPKIRDDQPNKENFEHNRTYITNLLSMAIRAI